MNDRLPRTPTYSSHPQVDPDLVNHQLEVILRSRAFRNAPLLQRFITYVTQEALAGRADDIKEYSIATEVLNRSSDFDPKTSPLVRVEARRLRDRLSQYYADEGTGDAVIFDIPRGGYAPTFVCHSAPASPEVESAAASVFLKPEMIVPATGDKEAGEKPVSQLQTTRISPHKFQSWALVFFVALGVSASIIVLVNRLSKTPRPSPTAPTGAETALKPDALILMLWSNLLGNARTAYVYYLNLNLTVPTLTPSRSVADSKSESTSGVSPPVPGLPTPNGTKPPALTDRLLSFDNVFAGAGEVQGVYALTRLLARVGIPVEVHGCHDLPKEAVSQHTVILLGPDLEKELRSFRPTAENFVFDVFKPANEPQRTRILNLHPLAGEQQFYETQRDPVSADTMEDWAVLSVLPGIRQLRKTVVMAGLTHTGTEAVAEFCASGTGVVTLSNRLGVGDTDKTLPPFYQVLLRVTIKQGSIIDIAYVAGRVIKVG